MINEIPYSSLPGLKNHHLIVKIFYAKILLVFKMCV